MIFSASEGRSGSSAAPSGPARFIGAFIHADWVQRVRAREPDLITSTRLIVSYVVVVGIFVGCGGSSDSTTGPAKVQTLTVAIGDGVTGQPSATQSVQAGATVNYDFKPATGYGHLVVRLDGADVPANGTVMMSTDHTLAASVDSLISLNVVDSAAIGAARQLLTAADPSRTLASLLEASWLDASLRGVAAASTTLDRVRAAGFDQENDAVALAGVASKLNGRVFSIDVGDDGAAMSSAASSQLPFSGILINELGTQPDELTSLLFGVRNILAHSSLPNYNRSTYRLLFKYNATAYLRYPDGGLCLSNAVNEGLARRLGIFALVDRVNRLCGQVLDLVRATGQIVDLLSWVPNIGTDATDLAAMIQNERRAGRGVILFGHSQGTLIAQQAFKTIPGTPDLNSAIQRCTGFISVAGPAPNQVLLRHLKNFYAQGAVTKDIIFHVATTQGNSGFRTDLTDFTDRQALTWTNALQAGWGDLALGLQLHALIGSYLTQTPMRDSIQKTLLDQVANIANDCVPTATRLAIVTQPSAALIGTTLDPSPSVEVMDADGNRVGSSSTSVTVSLTGPSGSLSGTKTIQAVNGVATFTDLRVSTPGTYQLTFSAAGLTTVTSASFTVALPPCAATSVSIPFTISGDLRGSQCTFLNAIALPYDFTTTSQRAIRFRLSGNSFTPRISAMTRDRGQSQTLVGTSSGAGSISFLLSPGLYTAAVGTNDGALSPFVFDGAFINENITNCESLTVLRPTLLTTSQSLSTSDCREGSSFADVFVIGSGRSCTITMHSTSFDAWLDVYDRNGNLIGSDDDGAGGTDATITLNPCFSGSDSNFIFDIYVHATSYFPGATGAYSLEFRFEQPTLVREGFSDTVGGAASSPMVTPLSRHTSRERPPKSE
ncbi:MAG: hypothetical protein ABR555_19235 [Pyrinomonadaceae bacterium]